jgi:hypothetical protein
MYLNDQCVCEEHCIQNCNFITPLQTVNHFMLHVKNILPLFPLLLILISCGSQPCQMANSIPAFVSFSEAETDTVVVRRFSKASNFTTLKDTFLLASANAHFQRMNDTTLLLQMIDQYNIITSTYDYEIFLPKANRLFKISDVVEKIQTVSAGLDKVACINPIVSYKINGQLISGTLYGYVYLNK